jgi:hypothetical protein
MTYPPAQALPIDLSTVCCGRCGVYDASLRCSSHRWVVSSLVKASENAHVGIWCARCRGIEAAKATAISLLAGWWSLRGPGATLAAVRANLKGGEQQHARMNAQMLRGIARLEFDKGNPELAVMFASAAHDVSPQRENSRLLDDLRRAGHRGTPQKASPWRFAPFVPPIVLAIALGALGLRALTGGDVEPATVAAVRRPALAKTVPAPQPRAAKGWNPNASADELEKDLASDSSPGLARAYFQARLREAKAQIPLLVRRGDNLWSLETSIAALDKHPALTQLLARPAVRTAYESLKDALRQSNRYYHGGAPVEAIQRTAGETLDVTVGIALDAIEADSRGHTERSDALADDAARHAQAVDEMKQDLRIRGAVITQTTKAIDACLDATRN